MPAGCPDELAAFLQAHRRVVAITGAGCSTRSGIPAYRDGDGQWLQRKPILYQDFIASASTRRRYWARSYFGWPITAGARVNDAHRALAAMEQVGLLDGVITQNVDGLHRRAGQRRIVELHGRLDRVGCLDCEARLPRWQLQQRLERLNASFRAEVDRFNADGDAELDARSWPGFRVVACERCGGRLKPAVVFFGENITPATRAAVDGRLARADAVLVVGSSLAVGSAYRLVRESARRGLPVVAVNQGRTRGDDLLRFKVEGDCDQVLAQVALACGIGQVASDSRVPASSSK